MQTRFSTLSWLTYFLKKPYLKKAIFQIILSGFKRAKSAKKTYVFNIYRISISIENSDLSFLQALCTKQGHLVNVSGAKRAPHFYFQSKYFHQ